jgi:hypothetical protein
VFCNAPQASKRKLLKARKGNDEEDPGKEEEKGKEGLVPDKEAEFLEFLRRKLVQPEQRHLAERGPELGQELRRRLELHHPELSPK